jgi:rhodanese-related sulfurtransferase
MEVGRAADGRNQQDGRPSRKKTMIKQRLLITSAVLLLASASGAQMKVDPSKKGHVAVPQSGNSGPLQLTPSNNATDPATAKRITFQEAAKLVKAGKAVYVDVRTKETYDFGHIPGALSIPNSQIMNRIVEIPPGKMVITYCACVQEHTAAVAVLNLNGHGFKNTAALIGGWIAWRAAGLPVEVTKR